MAVSIPAKKSSDKMRELLFVRRKDGSFGGWRRDLLTDDMPRGEERFLLCRLCLGLLREACLFVNEGKHEFRCSDCLPKDVAVQKAQINQESVNEKHVKCPLREKGCKWTDLITQSLLHLTECDFLLVECPLGCVCEKEGVHKVVQMERRFLGRHQKNQCPMRLIACESCESRIKACEMNGHIEICEEYLIPCPNSCMKGKMKRKKLPIHLGKDCPFQILGCPNAGHGCKEKMERRFLSDHQKKYCSMRLVNCEFCNSEMRDCEMNKHISLCEEFFVLCSNSCIEGVGMKRVKRKDLPIHLGEECPLQEVECPYAEYGCDEKMVRRLVGQHEKESIHKHFGVAMIRMQLVSKEQSNKIDLLEKGIKSETEKGKKMALAHANTIIEFNEKIDFLISAINNPNGNTVDWHITGVAYKIRNKGSSFGEPFYVGLYKFQCSIDWNFDNTGFVGCFISIMKGDWDEKLTWPLRFKRKFILINQKDDSQHWIKVDEITEEDLNKSLDCFKMPTELKNNGFGAKKFISHEQILKDKFVKNDSLSLKIVVERFQNSLLF